MLATFGISVPGSAIRGSSVVEQPAVNRLVVGSNPTRGAIHPPTVRPGLLAESGGRSIWPFWTCGYQAFGFYVHRLLAHAQCALTRPRARHCRQQAFLLSGSGMPAAARDVF